MNYYLQPSLPQFHVGKILSLRGLGLVTAKELVVAVPAPLPSQPQVCTK